MMSAMLKYSLARLRHEIPEMCYGMYSGGVDVMATQSKFKDM